MLQQIKSRFNNSVLFECEANSIKECLVEAVSKNANLFGAKLHGADLSGADLSGADLRDANLFGADLRGEILTKTPISILNLTWDILITEGYMRIGCQRHTHAEWEAFTDEAIADMESRASEFWKANREWLLAACKAHAIPKEQA
jgi:uncharacterized protein YjbI with pentapeptide repeats